MIKEVMTNAANIQTTIFALLIFVVSFSGFAFWTYKKANKNRYEEAGALPLSDGDKHE